MAHEVDKINRLPKAKKETHQDPFRLMSALSTNVGSMHFESERSGMHKIILSQSPVTSSIWSFRLPVIVFIYEYENI